jgi:hypothetical protein
MSVSIEDKNLEICTYHGNTYLITSRTATLMEVCVGHKASILFCK